MFNGYHGESYVSFSVSFNVLYLRKSRFILCATQQTMYFSPSLICLNQKQNQSLEKDNTPSQPISESLFLESSMKRRKGQKRRKQDCSGIVWDTFLCGREEEKAEEGWEKKWSKQADFLFIFPKRKINEIVQHKER